MKQYYVYILTSQKNGTLYIGMTNDLIRRIYEHKHNIIKGFTSKYNVKMLVYFEVFYDPYNAIKRVKQLKTWQRAWKIQLIERDNPGWQDLYDSLR